MANTGRISGKDIYATFGGTVLTADFTTFSIAETGDNIDVSAGADTFHYYIHRMVDATLNYEGFYDGATETVWDALKVGNAGTLIIGPKGTVAGYPKFTWSRALISSRNLDMPFADGVKVTSSFQASSLVSETVWP